MVSGWEGTYGVESQSYLNCTEERLSFPAVCPLYWCLLFSTARHHGKTPKSEKEVKDEKENLDFNASLRSWFGFQEMRRKVRWPEMELNTWSKLALLARIVIQQVLIGIATGFYKWSWKIWRYNLGHTLYRHTNEFLWAVTCWCELLLTSLAPLCCLLSHSCCFVFHLFVTKLNSIDI